MSIETAQALCFSLAYLVVVIMMIIMAVKLTKR